MEPPYYIRLGFELIEPAEQGRELRALVASEADEIPGNAARVALRRRVLTNDTIGYEAHIADNIIIRSANSGDRDFVVGLVASFVEFGLPAWRDAEVLIPRFRDALGRAVSGQDPRAAVLIAEGPDRARLGFIHVREIEDIEGVKRRHVADLAVAQHARRLGIGTSLMRAAESWAHDKGYKLLSLEVWSTNEGALKFYECLGYALDALSRIKPLD